MLWWQRRKQMNKCIAKYSGWQHFASTPPYTSHVIQLIYAELLVATCLLINLELFGTLLYYDSPALTVFLYYDYYVRNYITLSVNWRCCGYVLFCHTARRRHFAMVCCICYIWDGIVQLPFSREARNILVPDKTVWHWSINSPSRHFTEVGELENSRLI